MREPKKRKAFCVGGGGGRIFSHNWILIRKLVLVARLGTGLPTLNSTVRGKVPKCVNTQCVRFSG
jgi:hypothetical protein